MKTHVMTLSAALMAATALPASAQQAPPGSLGGGFIEFLATGRASGPMREREYIPGEPIPRSALPGEPPSRATRMVSIPAPRAERPVTREVEPQFKRQIVPYSGPHRPGTIIVDTPNKYLFLVQGGGTAIRYGIGVGRPGFTWAGRKSVTMKREWPDWRPPPEMLKRRPDLPRHMVGGIENPLGARALYLGSSLYRIHGTNEPHTIGRSVSSGCIRMTNDDVTDLYERVRVGTQVVVI